MKLFLRMGRWFFACGVVMLVFFAGVVYAQRNDSHPGPMFEKNDKREEVLERVRTLSQKHLDGIRGKHGIKKTHEFKVKRTKVDELAMAHTHVQHTHEGVPVWGSEAIVHLKADGSLSGITDGLVPNVVVDVKPRISSEVAIGEAKKEASKTYECPIQSAKKSETDLWVMRHEGKDHLVYRVQMSCLEGHSGPSAPVYFIDAHTFEVVFVYDNLQSISAIGTGTSLYRGTVSFTTEENGPLSYTMSDVTRRLGTLDMNWDVDGPWWCIGSDLNDIWGTFHTQHDPPQGVDVRFGSEQTYAYYLNVHNRSGLDGSGGPVTSYSLCQPNPGPISALYSGVRWGNAQNNAFWCPAPECVAQIDPTTYVRYITTPMIMYGDGDGTNYGPLVSLDIVGHEMTHGVTQYTAGLVYSGESGALNESMSDVFGAMIERYVDGESSDTWRSGEDVYTPGTPGDAARYMDTPHLAANKGYTVDDDPDHYSERYTGTGDNGGVHINSGIPNYAFYLLAKGGTHHVSGLSMVGIGTSKAEKIWYRALTTYMVSSTSFAEARTATLKAARDLHASAGSEYAAVDSAWCLVGLCDTDDDDDGVLNTADLCQLTTNPPVSFTDDPLNPVVSGTIQRTPIRALHFAELSNVVDAWRVLAGLGPAVWPGTTLTIGQTLVQAVHMDALRANLNAAFMALKCTSSPLTYTDPTITPKVTVIQKVHIDQLRKAAKGLK